MSLSAFELLQLEERFSLTASEVERALRRKFVACTHEGPLALERVNEAYRVLKDPVTRAEAIFELRGWSKQAAPNLTLLEQVFAERESIERARQNSDWVFLENWVRAARKRREALEATLAELVDGAAPRNDAKERAASAASCLDELRFIGKAIRAAEAALDAAVP
jgi:DnaJ-domain-containing protein 1